ALAAAAEAARAAEQAAAAANPAGADLAAVGEATLRSLPGNEGVRLAWNHAAIGNHLGGVYLDRGTEIMINGRRLATTPERTASVVEHEMGHIYQARIMAVNAPALGGWNASYRAMKSRLDAVFAGNGLEKSADCIALQFGATWVAYNSECGGERQGAVDALLAGRMP
ncbi:hypothetical protein, partial [Pengzhenrongella frigida]|uniref:hypothetical protein n=1 Tax=Pengzhenrongella frigida TaxID=1259133 RepID=UPI0013EDB7E9